MINGDAVMDKVFIEKLNEVAKRVNEFLDNRVAMQDNLQKVIYEAMRYSLLAGGKRIRPVLAIKSAEILGVSEEDVMPFACAIEMIHTYSLIHDDLPAMDNDDYRRGRLSCHKKFDEAIKIMEETAKLKGLTPARVASCYGNICSLYFNKNDYERAREYYKKAKSVPNGNWKYEYLRKKLGFQN